MKKILVFSSLISSCLAMGADCGCAEASAFDGVSMFAGLMYSGEKVESNSTEDVGFVTEQKIWNNWNNTWGIAKQVFGAMDGTPVQQALYVTNGTVVANALLDVKNAFSGNVYMVSDTTGEFDTNSAIFSENTKVVATGAIVNNDVRIKQSKSLKGFGGVLGAAYRFGSTDLGDAVFGVSFELNIRGKNKKVENFGSFDLKTTAKEFRFLTANNDTEANLLDRLAEKRVADSTGVPQVLPMQNGKIDNSGGDFDFGLVAANNVFYQVNTWNGGAADTTLVGDDGITVLDEYKNLLLVYNDGTTNMNREVKRGCIQPSLDFTAGYKFGEGKFLAEGFVGVTHVNTKVSYWNLSNQLVRRVKINKLSPSVGLNFGYAVSENAYAGVKARYIFNAKKGTEKIKNNYQVSLYLALNPKNAIAD